MNTISRNLPVLPFLFLALVGLPMLGIVLSGQCVSDYLEFPPLTRHVHHAGFSWLAFIGLGLAILAVVLPFDYRVLLSRRSLTSCNPTSNSESSRSSLFTFPVWGWIGLG
ncbi:MAG: hypothetical protein WCN95_14035, partial [bacterium]